MKIRGPVEQGHPIEHRMKHCRKTNPVRERIVLHPQTCSICPGTNLWDGDAPWCASRAATTSSGTFQSDHTSTCHHLELTSTSSRALTVPSESVTVMVFPLTEILGWVWTRRRAESHPGRCSSTTKPGMSLDQSGQAVHGAFSERWRLKHAAKCTIHSNDSNAKSQFTPSHASLPVISMPPNVREWKGHRESNPDLQLRSLLCSPLHHVPLKRRPRHPWPQLTFFGCRPVRTTHRRQSKRRRCHRPDTTVSALG